MPKSTNLTFIGSFLNLNFHRKLYIFGLFILALGLPLSAILTSVSQFILLGTWIIEGNFREKLSKFKKNKLLQVMLLLPLLHILWLLNTTDFAYALHDLKIKIPLLLFPLVLGTIKPINTSELKWVLSTFVAGVFMGTAVSIGVYTGIYKVEYTDIRSISIFISHIRFGLMVVMSLLILAYYSKHNWLQWKLPIKIAITLLALWLICFSIILQSVTSWVVAMLLILYFSIRYIKAAQNRKIKTAIVFSLFIFFSACTGLVLKVYHDFYLRDTVDLENLPQHTKRGNRYYHKADPILKENGHYLNILICNVEIKNTWPEVSDIPLNFRDENNFTLKSKLIRYLASKGLPKDTDGILALDDEDIKLLEEGYSSCIYRKKFIPYIKVYNLIWEIDRYLKLGDANNKSVAQRIEYLQTANYIIKNNFWLGVGTGDVQMSFEKAYVELKSKLKPQNRHRAHNQLVTFFITFGLLGLVISLFSIIYPCSKHKGVTKTLLNAFLIIILTSMLNEDTLETQAGVTFYIAFYALLIFTDNRQNG